MKNRIADTIIDLIGNTPLLRVNNFSRAEGLSTAPLAKLEYFNPAGSVKDRAALYMILDAEERGLLKPGATIIEPTSGNTGVGLAFICTTRGYKLILTMPDTMSRERMSLLKAYGAQLILTPGKEGMAGSIAKAQELCDTIEGAVILQQFENGANPAAHYNTTAEEIWRDTEGNIDAFVACVGTGGTISGTARRLKELNPSIKVIGVEPASSPVLNGGEKGAHKIQGIGAGFVPSIYDASVVDEVFCVTDEEAMSATRMLAATEGVLTGFSSGAALHAAAELIRRGGYDGKNVVVLLPDGGERYLSTELYA
ncbi:MAG: cysteine synthase A [Bacteroidaceae bacterium]|nr:cysteine synthase A [Bacteroidaceae bacterium]MBQ3121709.1 cysteine synthase A [Bacteroidaceae bacterium]